MSYVDIVPSISFSSWSLLTLISTGKAVLQLRGLHKVCMHQSREEGGGQAIDQGEVKVIKVLGSGWFHILIEKSSKLEFI